MQSHKANTIFKKHDYFSLKKFCRLKETLYICCIKIDCMMNKCCSSPFDFYGISTWRYASEYIFHICKNKFV